MGAAMNTANQDSTWGSWPIRWLHSFLGIALRIAMIVLVVLAALWLYNAKQPSQPQIVSLGPTVEQAQKLSELVTLRIYIADVLIGCDEQWIGNVEAAFLIKGDALISVDLAQMQVAKDLDKKTAVLTLPKPRILSARVDHERSRVWDMRKGCLVFGDDRAKAVYQSGFLHAQRLVEQVAGQDEWIDKARSQAEAILKGFYSALGWAIEIKWKDRQEAGPKPGQPATPAP
jgi:hypothetical protein